MFRSVYGLVPVATSPYGLCLTAENWHETQTKCLSFYLDALLLKPGIEVLQGLSHLKSYFGWSGTLILNATNLTKNKAGEYQIISPFDGSRIKLNPLDIAKLMLNLRPDAVLLPQGLVTEFPELMEQWPADITPFIHHDELPNITIKASHGVYVRVSDDMPLKDLVEKLETWPALPHYVSGSLSLEHFIVISQRRLGWVELDEPARLGFEGIVYTDQGTIDLKDDCFAQVFEPVGTDCKCPSCLQGFTQAYLHHLYHHTPLLCQRFLIQHNLTVFNHL